MPELRPVIARVISAGPLASSLSASHWDLSLRDRGVRSYSDALGMGVSSSRIVQAYMSEACMHVGVSLPVVYSVEAEAAQPRCDFIMGSGRRSACT